MALPAKLVAVSTADKVSGVTLKGVAEQQQLPAQYITLSSGGDKTGQLAYRLVPLPSAGVEAYAATEEPQTLQLLNVDAAAPSLLGQQLTSAAHMQLQTVDTPTGQCYLLMTPSQQNAALTGDGRQQQASAAFIPLSRFEDSAGDVQLDNDFGGKFRSKRRESHNEVEKRRRDKINQWINRLAKLLPDDCIDDTSRQLQSKGHILSKTVDFIERLKSTNQQLAAIGETVSKLSAENVQLLQLKLQVDRLTEENGELRARLSDKGGAATAELAKRPRTIFTLQCATSPPQLRFACVATSSKDKSTDSTADLSDSAAT